MTQSPPGPSFPDAAVANPAAGLVDEAWRPDGGDAAFSDADRAHMARALALAEAAVGLTEPNPRVGCVLVAPDGRVIGEGHTQQAGGPHAEVMALRDAAARGAATAGATAYVTLEPCAHHGRTPPCCDALVAAGLARVVAALGDPNPLVGGQGFARLRAAGIAVQAGLGAREAAELNIGFLSRMRRGRPWVRLKVAGSLDGRTALENGASQWITGDAARTDGHAWRRRAGAVLTGLGTVRDDDPRLDVRLVPTPRQPLRVVIDSFLDIDPTARILQPPGEVLLASTRTWDDLDPVRREALQRPHLQLLPLPADARGKNDLGALLDALGRRGVNELHVEAGHRLNASFLQGGLVDELLVYVAPLLLGAGAGLARLGPYTALDQGLRWSFVEARPVGADLRLRLRRPA